MYGLDGNAIGGTLMDVFDAEMTLATGCCAQCGRTGPVAELWVCLDGPGVVARCRACDNVLIVIVDRRGTGCVDLMGLAWLAQPGHSPLS